MATPDTFFGSHVLAVRESYPEVSCPIRIARHVLERINVTGMSEPEFTDFIQDLKAFNLSDTEVREEGVA